VSRVREHAVATVCGRRYAGQPPAGACGSPLQELVFVLTSVRQLQRTAQAVLPALTCGAPDPSKPPGLPRLKPRARPVRQHRRKTHDPRPKTSGGLSIRGESVPIQPSSDVRRLSQAHGRHPLPMPKRWLIRPHDAAQVQQLQRAAGVSAVVAQLLLARGIRTADQARQFLQAPLKSLCDPSTLPGAEAAAELLHQAVEQRRTIFIYGDYDVDGMSGCAILFRCLKRLGATVRYYIPNRLSQGYGLHAEALREIKEQGGQLVVTVDCGIASPEEAQLARQLGLGLIISDHHHPGRRLPEALAVVHPALPYQQAPFTGLCGAAVAFKLAWALCRRASGSQEKVAPPLARFLHQMLGYAALGTVADVVPLVGENRVLVRHGLEVLRQQPTVGVEALLRVSQLAGQPLASEDVAFALAPRLNAAGRLGQARLGVELLVTENPQRAAELAQYIDGLNQSRRSLEQSIYLAAVKQVKQHYPPEENAALVLCGHKWHPGVIGIVAGRLAEKYHRPVVMLSLDSSSEQLAVGSARSVGSFNLYEALAACEELLVEFGGHAAAAGLKVHPRHIETFRQQFCEQVDGTIAPEDRTAELLIDAEVPLGTLTLEAVRQLEQLAPFGEGNPRPVICTTGVELAGPPRTMGGGGRHLSLMLRQGPVQLRAVAFGQAEWAEPLERHQGPLAVAFRPVINQFNGRRSVELHLADWLTLEQLRATGSG